MGITKPIDKLIADDNLMHENESEGRLINAVTSFYQANTLLSKLLAGRLISKIAGNDSNLMTRVGEECAQMKDFILNSKSKNVVEITFSFASNEIGESWLSYKSEQS